jgi:hypothetical protein
MTARSSPSRFILLALALAPATPLDTARGEDPGEGQVSARPSPPNELIQAAPPPFTPGVFPCSDCHAEEGDRTRRTLTYHEEIQARFEHKRSRRWCLDCHDFRDRDMLHLSGGEKIPFTESYAVCGQCHYDKYRDWRLGIHGKRVGSWDGQKTYLLCVNCHDPHSPRIKPLRPERRPVRPMETRP